MKIGSLIDVRSFQIANLAILAEREVEEMGKNLTPRIRFERKKRKGKRT
jgi:hypothetical protein